MNKPDINELLENFQGGEGKLTRKDTKIIMEEYGKQMWNAALDWAVENAEANIKDYDDPYVIEDSILKGKI